MDAKTWASVKDIFAVTVDLAAEARAQKLDEICNGNDELRAEVEALLSAYDEFDNFIEQPVFSVADALPVDTEPAADKVIGNYRIEREIGRGGMGAVFLARRSDGEFQQEVAIKVVSSAFLGRESLHRFRQERQILAGLNHPNIARLLDGGVTAEGLPYLVMELVEGNYLIEHAEERALSIEDRLRLFLKICRAFAYAHAKLIVHRDIKPANILVTPDGEPKLLDFGLAKILDIENDHSRTATRFRALTPAYASPEQLRGEPITTASDIYSLGVVLYELMTGSRPFNHESVTFEKMAQLVSGSEPIPPSQAVSRSGSAEKEADQTGTSSPPHLPLSPAQLKGDIDNIVLMAMRGEPERRYRSVEQLADDIERHLDGLPITATEDTFIYRLSKFLQRNKVATAAAVIVALAIVAGLITTTWQARVAGRERDLAQRERDKAEQLNTFLQSILSAASPEEKGKNATVIEVLDDAATRIETELANQPELKAKALTTIGNTYIELGLPETAEPKLREALRIYTELYPGENKDKTRSMAHLGESLVLQYKFDESESIINNVIEIERGPNSAGNKELSRALFMLGELKVRQAKYQDAEILLNESISLCDELGKESEFDCAYVRIALGRAKQFSGDLEAAEAIFRRSLAVFRGQPSRYAIRIADLSTNLGDVLLAKSDYAGGIRFLKEADDIYQNQLGDSLNLVVSKFYLSRAYLDLHDNEKASQFAGRSIDIARKLGWIENRNFVGALKIMGLSLTRLGKAEEGESYLRDALERARKYLRPDDTRTPDVASALGECLTARRRFAEAETLLRDALAAQETQSDRNQALLETKHRLSKLLQMSKRSAGGR